MPKKASKPIEVDGHPYRWMVRKATSAQRGPHYRLTIEDSETKDIFQKDISYDLDAPPPTITPALVRDVIKNLNKPLTPRRC